MFIIQNAKQSILEKIEVFISKTKMEVLHVTRDKIPKHL